MTDYQQRARELAHKIGVYYTRKGSCSLDDGFFGFTETELQAFAAALLECSQDKARLDWLADRDNAIGNVQLPTMCVMNSMQDMRAAIDEAMQIDPEAWEVVAAADDGEVASNDDAARPQGVKDAT